MKEVTIQGSQIKQREGYGLRQFKDGSEYEGNWKHNMPNGKGKFKYSNGDVFEGQFTDGVINGQGEMSYQNG